MAYRQNRSVSRTKNGSAVRAGRPHLQILRAESSSSSRLSGLDAHHVVAAVITAAVGPVPVALCRRPSQYASPYTGGVYLGCEGCSQFCV